MLSFKLFTCAVLVRCLQGKKVSAYFVCRSLPVSNQCCGWSSPCGSYYDCKTPFSNNYQETLGKKKKKKGLLLTGPGNYMTHLGPHSKVASRKKAWGLGVLFLLEFKIEAWGFKSSLFIAEFETLRVGI